MKCQFVETRRSQFGLACDCEHDHVVVIDGQKWKLCKRHFMMLKYFVEEDTNPRPRRAKRKMPNAMEP